MAVGTPKGCLWLVETGKARVREGTRESAEFRAAGSLLTPPWPRGCFPCCPGLAVLSRVCALPLRSAAGRTPSCCTAPSRCCWPTRRTELDSISSSRAAQWPAQAAMGDGLEGGRVYRSAQRRASGCRSGSCVCRYATLAGAGCGASFLGSEEAPAGNLLRVLCLWCRARLLAFAFVLLLHTAHLLLPPGAPGVQLLCA